MELKDKKKKFDKENELQAASMQSEMCDKEDSNFASMAEKCLKQWGAEGKNIKPILLELKNYRKKAGY